MLINADAAGIEWRCVLHLSEDKVGIQEVLNGVDTHSENQKLFKLPHRKVAKIFLFRAIYKGSAWSYANDPQFSWIGGEKFWQGVIDRFYEKYEGIYAYHNNIISTVVNNGFLLMPTGRIYEFEPRLKKGEWQWPVTDICNYPVQGLAADLMAIVRVTLHTLLSGTNLRYLWINTVHDQILLDVDNNRKHWYNICIEIEKAFNNTAKNYELLFRQPLLVPMACDLKIGNNWLHLHKIKLNKEH